MNCKQLLIATLCVLFFCTAKAQMNAPIVDRIIRHDPSVKLFSLGMHAIHKYIVAAAVDQPAKELYLFSCLGKVFDTMPLNDYAYSGIMTNKISPFAYFDSAGQVACAFDLDAKNELHSTGKLDSRWLYVDAVEQMFHEQKANNNLQKMIVLEKDYEATSATRWEAGCYNPQRFNEDSLYADEAAKCGSMVTHGDTTIYYNANDLIPLFKAILLHQSGVVYYYNRRGVLLDSLHITHAATLVQQKADVFVMYRYWLERESNIVAEQINKWDAVTNKLLNDANLNGVDYVNELMPNEQLLVQLREKQVLIDKKIEWTYVPDFKAVATLLHYACKDIVQNTEFLETAGVGYFINFVRGQKQYELTDQRGNVLVTVSDKLIGMQTSGNRGGANVSYYAADIVGAQDYYSYGMMEPGRIYNTTSAYRYGYNGKEQDSALGGGVGIDYNYGFRINDVRVGRFFSVDPLSSKYPELSSYQYAGDRPIEGVDIDGLEFLTNLKAKQAYYFKQLVAAPENAQKVKERVSAQLMTEIMKTPSPSVSASIAYTPEQQARHDANAALIKDREGLNDDGSPKPLTRLANDKTWTNFSNNIALPIIEGAATDGMFKLNGGSLSLIKQSLEEDVEEAIENKIQAAANAAKDKVGPGKGPQYGTKVHTEFKNQIKALNDNGANVTAEVSYKNGIVVQYGTEGSVRADVVVGDVNAPSAVFDLKTGGAKLTPAQIAKYRANLPKSVKTIQEIKPQ